MDFTQSLARFIGRSVEIFQASQFIDGTLTSVSEGFYTVTTAPDVYTSGGQVTILESNTVFIRVLPA